MRMFGINIEEKLKSRKLIESLFFDSNGFLHYPFKINYKTFQQTEDIDFPAKFTVSVSKKRFKRAVDRNNIKRKIREAFRKNKYMLYENLKKSGLKINFIIIYISSENLDYVTIEKELVQMLIKLNEHLNKQNG
ncbi:MAG: ribonuclease P protein component [Bacteroidetes bacterium GWA2_31_9b]|nr:MAG: ribonuclease P protein component [Bacteroidetes bacterium GWA2_31_9b]